MVMIEISDSKAEKMRDLAEKMLKSGGMLMQCIEDLFEGESMGERWEDNEEDYDDMGPRGNYDRTPRRGIYGNRRGVRGTGRYTRYM